MCSCFIIQAILATFRGYRTYAAIRVPPAGCELLRKMRVMHSLQGERLEERSQLSKSTHPFLAASADVDKSLSGARVLRGYPLPQFALGREPQFYRHREPYSDGEQ